MQATTPLPQNLSVIALDSVVSRIEAGEHQRRVNDAAQLKLFSEALGQAASENFLSIRSGELVRNDEPAEIVYRTIRAELACALSVSEQTIERRLTHAFELTNYYLETFLVLSEGLITLAHTEVIATAGRVIGEGIGASTCTRRVAYEAAVLEHAVRETPSRLRPIARRLAEQYSEQTIDERYVEACQQRRVWVVDREDGMSDLTAHLPSVEAHAIYDRLTKASKELSLIEQREAAQPCSSTEAASDVAPGVGNGTATATATATATGTGTGTGGDSTSHGCAPIRPRTRNQLRTDLFSELLRASLFDDLLRVGETADERRDVHSHVQIFITDETLFSSQLRVDDNLDWGAPSSLAPAELAGSGPIDTTTARKLAATATHWDLARQHPSTGAVVSVDRYRPSEQMRRILGARDLHCRFPGCRAPIHRCDLDHTIDAAKGGPTTTTNLAYLCRGHHTVKHHGGWQVTQSGSGVLNWRSPAGRTYSDRPPSQVRFMTPASAVRKHRLPESAPY